MERFEKLIVWQRARELVVIAYKITKKYPTEEKFGLVSQMRRSAVSVASNIAEGSRRHGERDRIHFHSIADASLEELKCQTILSEDLEFITVEDKDKILQKANEVGRMLMGLNKTLLIDRDKRLLAVGQKL